MRAKIIIDKRLIALAIFAMAIGVYLNSLSGEFIDDDQPIVVENPLVRKPISLPAIFTSTYWPKDAYRKGGLYRPLTILSYAVNRRLLGEQPFGFHAVNVALHGITSLLVWILMGSLGFSEQASIIGALTFAVLPIHTEAVSWVVGRGEVLCAFFALAAWLLLQDDHWLRIGLGLISYTLALLSKESGAALPAILVLSDIFRRRTSLKTIFERRLIVWILTFGVLILYLVWRKAVLSYVFSIGRPYFLTESPLIICLTMSEFFLRGWLWPIATGVGLCEDYLRPNFPDATATSFLAWTTLLLILMILAWAARDFWKKRSPWAFSVLVFACFAAPLSNLLAPMEIIGAERIMYLPSIGFCLWVAAAWDFVRKRRETNFWRQALALGILLWWSSRTLIRNHLWQSNINFFSAAVARSPTKPRWLSALGMAKDNENKHVEARNLYRRALAIDPSFDKAAYNMGMSYYVDGDLRDAKKWFQYLEKNENKDKDASCMLGVVAEREGRPREALHYYIQTLELDPSDLEAHRNAGLLLYRLGNVQEAINQLQEYLRNGPPTDDAREINNFLKQIRLKQ